ncbi:sugar transferase [Enterococcus faecium]|uniref:sugar transferase n=1 Tax=Enterococcus faecium TaxID=1352 RepID=UPI0001B6E9D1|nr:sugar transferase [Enterococcus faecium]EEV49864.1 surface-anchored sugar transferase [Enterococcus faecium 1,141,733]
MMRKKTFYQLFGKRILDILLSSIALIVLSPIILIIGILVRIKLGSPIIFKQERPGKSEKIFSMYKFRTMTDERDHNGEYLPDEIRLTKFGKMLRATSLDELPELWNILKGDMSIVGPRPLLVEYLPLYSEKQRKRHNVRPGLTGLAQVNGRNAISWEEKFEYDYLYIEDYSFIKDINIICRTIKKVLKHDGITSDSSVTNEKFEGNEAN